MKNFILSTAAFFICICTFAQVPSYVPTNGLVGYWPFNGNANDESGNGNNGTVNGATLTSDRFGNVGKAYSFNGISDLIEVLDNNSLDLGSSYSISLWTIFNSSASFIPARYLLNKGCSPTPAYRIYYENDGTREDFTTDCFNPTRSYVVGPTTNYLWTNIIVTYNGSSLKLFINGTLFSSSNQTGSIFNSGNNLLFGCSMSTSNCPSLSAFFAGKLDDIAIYNRALSQSEITGLYNSGTNPCLPSYLPTNGLVGWWPFCGNANDESGNGNNGVVNGATLTSDRFGNANGAYIFNGVSNYIVVPNSTIFNNTTWSISAWVNPNGYYDGIEKANFMVSKGTDFNIGHYNLHFRSITKKARASIGIGTSTTQYVDNLSDINLYQWKCLTATWDGANLRIYTNGILENTTVISSNVQGINNENLFFGTMAANSTYPYWLNGKLDDIGIWNRALSSTEIQNLYTASVPTSCIANITTNDTTICRGQSVTLNAESVASGSVTDINGNAYPTVNIGSQTWLQKNLNVSKYKNGVVIPQVTDATQWAALTTGAWCWYNNDSANYAATYGKLYNWYAVNDPRGLAPEGWHVPTSLEWDSLAYIVAGNVTNAGGPLKETGTFHWFTPNTGATNSTNFNGLPGGFRANQDATGEFYKLGSDGWFFFNAAGNIPGFKNLYYENNGLNAVSLFGYYNYFSNTTGASVRLIKNVFIPNATNYTYLWSTGATTPSITVTPLVTTTYYCSVSDGISSCMDSVKITVNNFNPNLFTQDTIKACGASYSLNPGAGYTSYLWNTGATTQTINATNTGWYKCTISNGTCTGSDSVFVSIVNANIVNNDTTICSGGTINLTLLNGNLTEKKLGFELACVNTVNPPNNASTSVKISLPIGEWSYLALSKSSNNDCSLYMNGQLIYSGSYANISYSWTKLVVGSQLNGGNYFKGAVDELRISKSVRNSGDISNSYYSNIPFTSDSNTILLCHFDQLSGATSTSVSGPNGTLSNTGWTTGKFGNGILCNGVSSHTDFNLTTPTSNSTIEFWVRPDSIMLSWPIMTSGYNSSGLLFNPYNTITSNCIWSTGATTPSISVSPTQTTTYYCTVSNGISSCTDSVTVYVKQPTSSTTNISVCANQLPYVWNGSSYNAAGTYNKTLVNAAGCDSIATLILSFTAFNPIVFVQDTIRACGSSYSLAAASGYSSYSWNTAATTQSINVNSTGWYKCTVSNGNCIGADSVFVSILNANIVNNDTTICRGATITLSATANSEGESSLPANLRNGLVGYWPFNGNANDESGNGNHGVVNGATLSTDRYGVSNKSYSFNGVDNFIEVPDNSVLHLVTQYSFSVWINVNAYISNVDIVSTIFAKERYLYSSGYGLSISNSGIIGEQFNNCPQGSSSCINAGYITQTIAPLNQWKMITCVHDGQYRKLYLDGTLIAQELFNYQLLVSNLSLFIGKEFTGITGGVYGASNRYFNGQIDDIVIWNRPVSNDEVQNLYRNSIYAWSTGASTQSISVSPTQTTTYYCTISNGINSCTDSVTIYVKQPSTSTTNTSICSNQLPYSWNGLSYNTSGSYSKTLTNAAGCDSIATLNLTIKQTSSSTTNTTACGSYIWNGVTYTSSGTYNKTLVNAVGCDSIATLNLTLTTASNTAPSAINGARNINRCDTLQNYSVLPMTGVTFTWTVTGTGNSVKTGQGTNAVVLVMKVAGTISVKATNACGTVSTATTLAVTKATPATPGTISQSFIPTTIAANTNTCLFTQSAFATTGVADTFRIRAVANATGYIWKAPVGSTLTRVNDTTIAVVFANTITVPDSIKVYTLSACDTSLVRGLALIKTTAAAPGSILKTDGVTVAVTDVCPNVGGSVTYKIRKVATAISYNWTMTRGTKATITHINPLGVNDTAVIVSYQSGFTADSINVSCSNGCGTSAAKLLKVSAILLPPTPSTITASTANFYPCPTNTVQYTVASPVATTAQSPKAVYRWTRPANTTIIASNADSSVITIRFEYTYTGGSLSVKCQTACGIQGTAKTQTLYYTPPTPTGINSGSGYNVCIGSTVSLTCADPVSGGTGESSTQTQTPITMHHWTKPSFTSITSSTADSGTISLLIQTGFTGGNVSAKCQSSCGTNGTAKSQALTHTACPAGTKNSNANTGAIGSFDVNIFPNPTKSAFNLQVSSTSREAFAVKVLDVQGRLIKSLFVYATEINNIGNDLKSGVYMVEITQGKEKKTVRVVRY